MKQVRALLYLAVLAAACRAEGLPPEDASTAGAATETACAEAEARLWFAGSVTEYVAAAGAPLIGFTVWDRGTVPAAATIPAIPALADRWTRLERGLYRYSVLGIEVAHGIRHLVGRSAAAGADSHAYYPGAVVDMAPLAEAGRCAAAAEVPARLLPEGSGREAFESYKHAHRLRGQGPTAGSPCRRRTSASCWGCSAPSGSTPGSSPRSRRPTRRGGGCKADYVIRRIQIPNPPPALRFDRRCRRFRCVGFTDPVLNGLRSLLLASLKIT